MNPWISVCVSIVMGFLVIGAAFYNRFVPDVDTQKRHVKRAAIGSVAFLLLSFQLLIVYRLAHTTRPVTPGFVIAAAFSVGFLFFDIMAVFSLFYARILDNLRNTFYRNFSLDYEITGRQIRITELQNEISQRVIDAVKILASQPDIDPVVAKRILDSLHSSERFD